MHSNVQRVFVLVNFFYNLSIYVTVSLSSFSWISEYYYWTCTGKKVWKHNTMLSQQNRKYFERLNILNNGIDLMFVHASTSIYILTVHIKDSNAMYMHTYM